MASHSHTPSHPAPPLNIPASQSTVHVQIIDTTTHITGISLEVFLSPPVKSHVSLNCPSFSFLITHPTLRRSLLFDLGARKDWDKIAPRIYDFLTTSSWGIEVKSDVREILQENGVPLETVEAIIWSHWHWDHTGDPATFPSTTALIVGPGFTSAFVPGYPANATSPILESDYAGRELRELDFAPGAGGVLRIGGFRALDYFGDGSFYILDAPGHAVGHLCAMARVTPASFIFMGGDACHHNGEFRPSRYVPLPDSILPHPLHPDSVGPCPGVVFERILRDGDRAKPFYKLKKDENGKVVMGHDGKEAERTIDKVMGADADEQVLVVMAHDDSLVGVVDFFPAYVDDFAGKGWVEKVRWRFLKDFAGAVES